MKKEKTFKNANQQPVCEAEEGRPENRVLGLQPWAPSITTRSASCCPRQHEHEAVIKSDSG